MAKYSKELIKAIKGTDFTALDDLAEKNVPLSIEEASFSGDQIGAIELSDVSCVNTEWEACIFDGTKFNHIDFQGAFFNSCSFHGCSFTDCIFAETSFEGCVFKSSTVENVEDAEALEINGCQFEDSNLKGIHFIDTNFTAIKMTGGNLAEIDGEGSMSSVSLRNVAVSNVDTSEMELVTCTASGCASLPAGFKAVSGTRRRV